MKLKLDTTLSSNYKSNSQIARIVTESWVEQNIYCPSCGEPRLMRYGNNKKVADYYCKSCSEDFELKSKNGNVGKRIVDGAYDSMIERITSNKNPNFFFLSHINWTIHNFFIIPKYFFVPLIIEKRNPLPNTARRAGWVGCNINLTSVPAIGRIFIIKESKLLKKEVVLSQWQDTLFVKKVSIETKGWLFDILNCLDKIPFDTFTLDDVYKFENSLKQKHPNNNFIRDKIRQQLQLLRDKGFIEFTSIKGKYKKVKS